jgi:hypothetical protein
MSALVKVRNDAQRFKNAFLGRHPEVWDKLSGEDRLHHHRDFLDAITELDGNTLQLGLLLDRQADDLGRRVRALADTAHILFAKPCQDGKTYPIPMHDECLDRLNKMIADLCSEMRPLWETANAAPLLTLSRKSGTTRSQSTANNAAITQVDAGGKTF